MTPGGQTVCLPQHMSFCLSFHKQKLGPINFSYLGFITQCDYIGALHEDVSVSPVLFCLISLEEANIEIE